VVSESLLLDLEEEEDLIEADTPEAKQAGTTGAKEADTMETKEADTPEAKQAGTTGAKEADTMETKEVDTMEAKEVDTMETKEVDTMEAKEADTMETKEVGTMEAKEADMMEAKEADTMEAKEADMMEAKEAINTPKIAVISLEAVSEALEDVIFYLFLNFFITYNEFLTFILDRSKFDTAEVGVINTNPII